MGRGYSVRSENSILVSNLSCVQLVFDESQSLLTARSLMKLLCDLEPSVMDCSPVLLAHFHLPPSNPDRSTRLEITSAVRVINPEMFRN